METGYIYVIINQINGKFYFGKSFNIKKRWNRHIFSARKGVNRKLYDSMNHHGYKNFSVHKIGKYESESKKELSTILNEREVYFISLTESIKFGYNMSSGGDGGFLGDEAVEKTAKKMRGRKLSKEHRKKISEGNKGISKPLSKETKRKISETNKIKGIKPPVNYWGREGFPDHPLLGKNHSNESKKKMSKWRSGKTFEEIYGLEKAAKLKKNKSKRWQGKNNPNYIDIDLDEAIFYIKNGRSVSEICQILNIKYPTLLNKIKKKTGKTITELRNEETCNN